jgi:DNA-binding NarL/FixJ family response regulator
MERIRILLADDHEAVLNTVSRMLSREFDIVGTASDGQMLLDETERLQPEILITDISMPLVNGIEAVRRLKEAGSQVKVVFLTIHDDADYAREATAAGALGYVVKSRMTSDLVEAIKAVHAGEKFISPTV